MPLHPMSLWAMVGKGGTFYMRKMSGPIGGKSNAESTSFYPSPCQMHFQWLLTHLYLILSCHDFIHNPFIMSDRDTQIQIYEQSKHLVPLLTSSLWPFKSYLNLMRKTFSRLRQPGALSGAIIVGKQIFNQGNKAQLIMCMSYILKLPLLAPLIIS